MTRAAPLPSSADRGFTLAEMLVVLAIVALTTAALVPLVGRTRSTFTLRTTAELIAADLRDVRTAAIASGAPRALVVMPGERRISSAGLTPERLLPAGLTLEMTGGAPVAGGLAVRFGPDGAASPARMSLNDGTARVSIIVPGGVSVAQVVTP
jgi:general secretion pathway protein H